MNATCDTKAHQHVPATHEIRVWDNGDDAPSTQHIVCEPCMNRIADDADNQNEDYAIEELRS